MTLLTQCKRNINISFKVFVLLMENCKDLVNNACIHQARINEILSRNMQESDSTPNTFAVSNAFKRFSTNSFLKNLITIMYPDTNNENNGRTLRGEGNRTTVDFVDFISCIRHDLKRRMKDRNEDGTEALFRINNS